MSEIQTMLKYRLELVKFIDSEKYLSERTKRELEQELTRVEDWLHTK